MLLPTLFSVLPLLSLTTLVNAQPERLGQANEFAKRETVMSKELIDKVRTLAYNLNNKR